MRQKYENTSIPDWNHETNKAARVATERLAARLMAAHPDRVTPFGLLTTPAKPLSLPPPPPVAPIKPLPTPTGAARRIIAAVALSHGTTVAEIVGSGRLASIMPARREAAVRLHQSGRSLAAIGRALNRDHTTIMHHLRVARDLGVYRYEPQQRARPADLPGGASTP